VEVTPESSVKVNVSVFIKYGAYAPQVFEDVKNAVVKQVTGMTGLEVAGVNLRIEDVLTSEEYDKSKTSADETLDADPSKGESVEETSPSSIIASPTAEPEEPRVEGHRVWVPQHGPVR